MTPEIVLGLVLSAGPYPGGTLYSQQTVVKEAPTVISVTHKDHGRSFKSYRILQEGEDAPYACKQKHNPACMRPRYDGTLKRWQRPETYGEGMERYWDIAKAISKTKLDDGVLPYAITIFRHESGMFRLDVHEGTNHRPFRNYSKHEDGGQAWGFGQVMWSVHPHKHVPIEGFKHLTLGDLVGLDEASTFNSVAAPIARISTIIKRCGVTQPACVFVGYAGTRIKSTHPLMRARLATYARIKRMSVKDKTLSSEVKKMLGIDKES